MRTWRSGKDESSSWPHRLAAEFPNVAVWALDYAASPTKWTRIFRSPFASHAKKMGHSVALPRRAVQVLDLMVQRGIGQRPLVLICHSLGGLLAKHILRAADQDHDPQKKQLATLTRAVMFLATPHNGASLASWMSSFRWLLGATVSIEELREHDAYLEEIGNWYQRASARLGIQTVTYYELLPLKGVLPIVSPSSAHCSAGTRAIGLDEDHISIAKPCERDAQVCVALRNLLHPLVGEADLAPPRDGATDLNLMRVADDLALAAQLRQLLARLADAENSAATSQDLRRRILELMDENSRLRDEITKLRVNELERLTLRSKIEVMREFLSKRDDP